MFIGFFLVLWLVSLAGNSQAQVQSGSYSGNGTASRAITGIGFQPDVVIIKSAGAQVAVIRSSTMSGDNTKDMTGATALATNCIQSLASDGFTVGTDAKVNGSSVVYQWIAFKTNSSKLKLGTYAGDSQSSHAITNVGFSPELVIIMSAAANNLVLRSSADALTYQLDAASGNSVVSSLDAGGFTVGSDPRANSTGTTYHYLAWTEIAGEFDVGSYSGDGNDSRNITGVGFLPEFVMIKSTSSYAGAHHCQSLGDSTDSSQYFSATANSTNEIQALQTNGFQIGTGQSVNQAGVPYVYFAWRQTNDAVLPAAKLAITSVNGGSNPVAGTAFSVVVQAQDANGNAANVVSNTAVTFSLNTGSGTLGGSLSGTITAGTNSVTISGVTYTKAESGVVITVTRTSGDSLTAANSSAFTVNAATAWYNSPWSYRIAIIIDHTLVSSTLTNFPVLINLTNSSLRQYALTNGNDLLFTSDDGTNKLAHEIERYTGTNGALVAWVKVPLLSSTTDTTLYLYYGNPSSTNQQNVIAVWDSSYKSVWHLSQTPTGSAGDMADSTTTNNGTSQTIASGAQVAGAIAGSLTLDGASDYISTATSFNNPTTVMVEAWVKTTSTAGHKVVGFESTQTGTASANYDRHIFIGTDGKARFGDYNGSAYEVATSTSAVNDGNWHHIVGYRDNTAGKVGLYVDGVLQGTPTTSTGIASINPGWYRIGSYRLSGWSSAADGYFTGSVDEVRMSHAIRSAAWIATEYNNQDSPATFYSLGSQETAPPTKLAITTINGGSNPVAGTVFSVVIQAQDANGNAANVVSNTAVTLSLNTGSGTLGGSLNGTITAGTNSITISAVTYTKAESGVILTATRTSGDSLTAGYSAPFTVNAGAFAKLQLLMPGETASPGSGTGKTGTPTAQTSGIAFNVTVNSVDANWNVVSTNHTVGITSSDANATLPSNAALVAGTKTFSVTFKTAGSATVTATDVTDGTKTASTSPTTTVNAGAFAKLQLLMPGETVLPGSGTGKTGTPTAQTAGSSFNVTVNAVDANWNVVSTNHTVGITSSDANASLPSNAALLAGTKTFNMTLKTAGSATITATDITDGSKTANTSPSTTVNAGAFSKLQVLTPGESASPGSGTGKTGSPTAQTAGTAFNVIVNAVDANWNAVNSTHTVGITSSDSNATLPSNAALVTGTKTFSVTLKTAGSATVTATDITDGTKTANTSPSTTVNPGALHHLAFAAISTQTAGTAFNVTITAQDANNNTVSGFTGTANLSTTAGTINPTVSGPFSSGVRTESVTVSQTGSGKTITATKAGGSETGTSSGFTVNPGAIHHYVVSATTSQTAGTPFTVTVTAEDTNNNTVTTDSSTVVTMTGTGSVQFDSNGNSAFGDNTKTLSSGVFTISTRDTVAEVITITATSAGPKTGTSSSITINPGAIDHYVVSASSPQTAGTNFTVTVTAKDTNNNTVTTDSSTVVTMNGTGSVQFDSNSNGAFGDNTRALSSGAFTITTKDTVAQSITINATDGNSKTGSSSSITINPGAIDHYVVSAATPQTVGTNFNMTVTSKDSFNNTVTTDSSTVVTITGTGSVQFDSNGNGIFGDNTKTLSSGAFTIKTRDTVAESITVTATDGNSKTGTSSSITIQTSTGAAAIDHYVVSASSPQTAGSNFTTTVTAKDSFNNTVTTDSSTLVTLTGTGSVQFDSDGDNTFGVDIEDNTGTLSNGVFAITTRDNVAEGTTLTATDGNNATGTSSNIVINPGPIDHYSVSAPSPQIAGTAFTTTVVARDSLNNAVTTDSSTVVTLTGIGSVQFDSDGNATFGDNTKTLSCGAFTISSRDAVAQSITLTATDGNSKTGTSSTITVNPGPIDHYVVSATTPQTAGTDFNTTVTAEDCLNNTVTTDNSTVVTVTGTGSVQFDSDGNGTFGDDTKTLSSGVLTISTKDNLAESISITATDGNSKAGCSSPIAIETGAFAKLQLLMPGETASPGSVSGKTGTPNPQTVGTALSVTVNAVDANWNPISTNDSAQITSSDTAAVLPSSAPLSGGTGSFSVTFKTAGAQTVTASDVTHPGIASNTGTITTVNMGDQNISFNSPGDQTYGATPITLDAIASSGLAVSYSVVLGPATVSSNSLTITGVGSVTIRASQAGDANWNAASPVNRTISIAQKSLTGSITANNKIYDGTTAATILSRSLTGTIGGDDVSLVGGTATFSDENVGSNKTVTVTGLNLDGANAGNYALASSTASTTANITPATLTVTANNASRVYGAANPLLTASYGGFIGSEDQSVLSGSPSLSTPADTSSSVGGSPYSIVVTNGTLSATNYAIAYVNGQLTITPASSANAVSTSANPSPTGSNVTFHATLTAVAPGSGTPTGTVQFLVDGLPLGSSTTMSSGVACLVTNSLSHGTHNITAAYAGDGNFLGSTNILSPDQIINTTPVASNDGLQRYSTSHAKMRIATLLANDTDADGDTLTLSSVSATSAQGGTVVASNIWVFYTPPAGFTNSDSFSYVVSDGGLMTTGTVAISIVVDLDQSQNISEVEDLGTNSSCIHFSGIPGRIYKIQYTENLETPVWQSLGTNTADACGLFYFTDTPPGPPARTYRSTHP